MTNTPLVEIQLAHPDRLVTEENSAARDDYWLPVADVALSPDEVETFPTVKFFATI